MDTNTEAPVDRKEINSTVHNTDDVSDFHVTQDWTPKKSAMSAAILLFIRIDFIIIPILALTFSSLQMDRGNISAVLTSTITDDLHVNTNAFNVGAQLLSAGIVLTEIPSNILLQKFGPRPWLSFQLFAWGLIATFQAFVKNYPSYLATRVLLGLFEGGYIPANNWWECIGALFYLSTWYKKSEASSRVTLFFFDQMFSAATTGLISAGLLSLKEKHGLAGWRWIFLVEGLITIFIGFIFVLLLPPKVGDGRPLISCGRWSYFSERESRIIKNRVLLNDSTTAAKKEEDGQVRITGRDAWNTATRPNIMQHVFLTLVSMTALSGLTTYTPTLIKSFGYNSVQANALASVPIYTSMVLTYILAYIGDRTGFRGPLVLLATTWNVMGYACLKKMPLKFNEEHKYGIILAASTGYASMHILNVGWVSVNCRSPQERSVAMALIIMAANAAGIPGAQIFRTSDAPHYPHGLTAICVLAGVSWVLAAVLNLFYRRTRSSWQV